MLKEKVYHTKYMKFTKKKILKRNLKKNKINPLYKSPEHDFKLFF